MTTNVILLEALENRAADLATGFQVCTPEPPDHCINVFRMKSFRTGEIVDSVKSCLQQGNLEVSDCVCSLGATHDILLHSVGLNDKHMLPKILNRVKDFFATLSKTPGDRIKAAREQLGLRPIDLARKMGMPPSDLSRYESGQRTPGRRVVAKFAKALYVEDSWIMYGKGKGPGEKSDQDRKAVKVVHDYWACWDRAEVGDIHPTALWEALQDPATREAFQIPEVVDFLRRYAKLDADERRWILRQIEERELLKLLREGKGKGVLKDLTENPPYTTESS